VQDEARERPEAVADGAEAGASAEHLARVAARLFAARGYDATSVREIVEAAGVSKPTLYYHFGSKEGLAQALVRRPMERLRDQMRARLEAEADPVEALVAMVQAKFDFCVEDPDRTRFFHAVFFGPLATGLAEEVARCGDGMDSVQHEAIRRLVGAGVVEASRAEDFFLALHGLVVIHTLGFLYRGRPIRPDQARRIVEDLLRGFGAGRAGGA
jgi:AcrR family transcriptional regulator